MKTAPAQAQKLNDQLIIIKDVASVVGGGFEPYYSGRGMYGKTCAGVLTDDPDTAKEEAVIRGLRGAREDNMGKSYIVYWPTVETDWESKNAGPSRE